MTTAIIGIDSGSKYTKVALLEGKENSYKSQTVEFESGSKSFENIFSLKNGSERLFSSLAKNLQPRNIQNSLGYILDLFSEKYDIEKLKFHNPFNIVESEDNHICLKLKYESEDGNEEERIISVEELYFMFIDKTMNYINENRKCLKELDSIIMSIPSYLNMESKEMIKEMLKKINEKDGCKNIEIINDYLGYVTLFGIENNDEIKQTNKNRRILFVNMGNVSLNVCSCEYDKDKCKILSYKYEKNIGGRIIDEYLMEDIKGMIIEEGNEIESNNEKKVYYRIMDNVIKMKEKLSAQGADTINIHIDQILEDDEDYDGEYSIDKLNEVIQKHDIWNKIKSLLDECLNESCWNEEELKDLEICTIGGSMRITKLKDELLNYLKEKSNENNKNLTLTLNMDDCISQGNSYYGLIESGKYLYTIEDESKYKRCEEANEVKMNIDEYWKDIERYKKRDRMEIKKASKRNAIEKIKYESDHSIADNKIDENYSSYINLVRDYFEKIYNFIKDRNVIKEKYENLDLIYEDESNHIRIMRTLIKFTNQPSTKNLKTICEVLNINESKKDVTIDNTLCKIIQDELMKVDYTKIDASAEDQYMRDIKDSIYQRISLEPKYENQEELMKKSNESFKILIPLLVNDINRELIEQYEKDNINNIIPENKVFPDKFEYYSKYERKFLSFNQFAIDFRFINKVQSEVPKNKKDATRVLSDFLGVSYSKQIESVGIDKFELPEQYKNTSVECYFQDVKEMSDGWPVCNVITSFCQWFSEGIMALWLYIGTLPFFVQPFIYLFMGLALFVFFFFGFFFFVVFSPIWIYIFCLYEIIYHFWVEGTNTQPVYDEEEVENNECGVSAFVSATIKFNGELLEKISKKIEPVPHIFKLIINGSVFLLECLFWLLFFAVSPIWIFIFILFNAFYLVLAWCTNTESDYTGDEKDVLPRTENKEKNVTMNQDINQRLLDNEN